MWRNELRPFGAWSRYLYLPRICVLAPRRSVEEDRGSECVQNRARDMSSISREAAVDRRLVEPNRFQYVGNMSRSEMRKRFNPQYFPDAGWPLGKLRHMVENFPRIIQPPPIVQVDLELRWKLLW